MFLRYFLLILTTLVLNAHASLNARTFLYTNSSSLGILAKTSSGPSASGLPPICCFAVQDVVREEWWDITTTSSIWTVVNLSKITAHVSSWPGTTHTSYETNVQTTNASFSVTAKIGNNPISLFNNGAPRPTEVTHSNEGSALVTGGVTVQSPAAFYVYSTVKIITADAVSDSNGNWACGTPSGGFPNMNENAQSYFGAPFIKARVNTPVTSGRDDLVHRPSPTDPVVISLTTPFIYQPERGRTGATVGTGECTQTPGTEDYGYVPQTVLNYLAGNRHYASQFFGLSSCIPAGPPIIPLQCPQLGGSLLTFTTTFTSTPPLSTSLRTSTSFSTSTQLSFVPGSSLLKFITSFETSFFESTIEGSINEVVTTQRSSFRLTMSNFNSTFETATFTDVILTQTQTFAETISTSASVISQIATETEVFEGSTVANFIKVPHAVTEQVQIQPPPTVVTQIGASTAPPAGIVTGPAYKTNGITDLTDVEVTYATQPGIGGGTDAVNVNTGNRGQQAKTDASGPAQTGSRPAGSSQGGDQSIANAICEIAGSCPKKDGSQVNNGVTSKGVNIIIPNPTTIPAQDAPLGLPGKKTEIDGTKFIIVPSPTTFVASSPHPADVIPGAKATIIGGTPFIVIPSATNIPVVNAPSALKGSITMIDNTPFFAIPGSTRIPAPSGITQFSGITSIIGGTPFIVIPKSTNIPVANAPPGITGSLTIINNTPFLVVPGATNIPAVAPSGAQAALGSTTVINGKPMLVIPGPTNIPLSDVPSGLAGITTTINGVPFLVVPSATSIPVPIAGPGSPKLGTTTLINGTPFLIIPSATHIPLEIAPATLKQGASTTIINGTPFLVIPSATTVQLPTSAANIPGAITTIINGSPVLIFPSATRIPLSLASGISGGRTTTIDGTPFLVIPGPTTVADQRAQITGLPGSLAVIDGTTELIITGPTTVLVDSRFSISGRTTVIDGTTKVVVSKPTTVPLETTTTRSTSSSDTISSTSDTSTKSKSTTESTTSKTSISATGSSTPTSSSQAQDKIGGKKGLSTGAKVGIAFAVIFGLLLIAALIFFILRRRRQRYMPVQQSAQTQGS